MPKSFQCLLAETIPNKEHWGKLQYPLYGSPKIDGIRALAFNGKAMSRKMLPIPNIHVQSVFKSLNLHGLDGEIVVGSITATSDEDIVFKRTSSGVMSKEGKPDFRYYIFDSHLAQETSYKWRFLNNEISRKYCGGIVVRHEQRLIKNVEELIAYEEELFLRGFEGLMVRKVTGSYKRGRSTLNEEILLKIKRFADIDCVVLGYYEGLTNNNPATTDATGHTKRSTRKGLKIPNDTLGSILVKDTSGKFDKEFTVNGKDADWNKDVWDNRDKYLGKILVIKYQPAGSFKAPRFPVIKDWRYD